MNSSQSREDDIRQIVEDCLRRRADGESLSDHTLIDSHPELMPELAEELRRLKIVEKALPRSEMSTLLHTPVGSSAAHRGELTRIAQFELLEQVGMGKFGSVWKARDTELDRIVAVKIPRAGALEEAETEQFFREARAAAQVEHPNIVSVHEVGRECGIVYVVSDFIDGANLQDYLSGRDLSFDQAAKLCATVAYALHAAHQAGVVHRDLKPSNIMMDIEGTPHVADFGLAKREAGEITITVKGQILGTPAYMPPEQIGKAHDVDGRADVYSLGVILYHLLTGELPFRGHPQTVLLQIQRDEPAPPRKLNHRIPRDLETICLKAMAKEPARRYATAAEMADDLQRQLDGRPIQARPVGPLERSFRWCRRNPLIASLAAGVASLLLIVAVGSGVYAIQLRRYAQSEHQARTEAEGFFRVAVDAIDEMVITLGDESLADVPQMASVRRNLLERALDLHQELLQSRPSHSDLQLVFARAQHRMGNLYELLGEIDRAKAAYAQAIRLCQRLAADSPDEQARNYLAQSHTMLGELLRKTAPQEAMRHFEKALDLQQVLLRSKPENNEYRRELSRTLNNLGILLTETGQYRKAESALKGAIQHLEILTQQEDADQPDWQADLGRSQINLGVLLRAQPDRQSEAEAAYRDAIKTLQILVGEQPENRDYQYRLAVALVNLGNYLKDLPDRTNDSVASTRQANSKLNELCENFPGIPLYWYELANSRNSLAIALYGIGDKDGLKKHLDAARQTLSQLALKFPKYEREVADYQSLKGIVLGGLAAYDFQIRDDPNPESAQQYIEKAIEHQLKAAKLGPNNPTFIQRLSAHRAFLSQILKKRGLVEPANKESQEAEKLKTQAAKMKRESKSAPAAR